MRDTDAGCTASSSDGVFFGWKGHDGKILCCCWCLLLGWMPPIYETWDTRSGNGIQNVYINLSFRRYILNTSTFSSLKIISIQTVQQAYQAQHLIWKKLSQAVILKFSSALVEWMLCICFIGHCIFILGNAITVLSGWLYCFIRLDLSFPVVLGFQQGLIYWFGFFGLQRDLSFSSGISFLVKFPFRWKFLSLVLGPGKVLFCLRKGFVSGKVCRLD